MPDQLTINWTPPATWYIYDADLYCKPCGEAIQGQLLDETCDCSGCDCGTECKPECASNIPERQFEIAVTEDSNSWPQEYSKGEGESDSPDHCGNCQRFLGRHLTDDGVEYVKQSAIDELARNGAIGEVVQGWLDYYEID
jgi:hypothetical protein